MAEVILYSFRYLGISHNVVAELGGLCQEMLVIGSVPCVFYSKLCDFATEFGWHNSLILTRHCGPMLSYLDQWLVFTTPWRQSQWWLLKRGIFKGMICGYLNFLLLNFGIVEGSCALSCRAICRKFAIMNFNWKYFHVWSFAEL